MPTVTFNVLDIAGAALPAGVVPKAILKPSGPAALSSGAVIATEPREYTPNSAGLVTATVIDAGTVLDPAWHMQLVLRWQNPDGYGTGQGYSQMDFPGWEIRVTGAGGKLVDFIKPPTSQRLWWVDVVPPPSDSYQWWVDLSTTPPTLKENV